MFTVVAEVHVSVDVAELWPSHDNCFLISVRVVCPEVNYPLHKDVVYGFHLFEFSNGWRPVAIDITDGVVRMSVSLNVAIANVICLDLHPDSRKGFREITELQLMFTAEKSESLDVSSMDGTR